MYILASEELGGDLVQITDRHFGVNLVTIYDEEYGEPNSRLASLVEDSGCSTLRFPGGSATEHYFDMTNPNSDISPAGNQALLPMDQFFRQAGESNISASIVIPTKMAFGVSAAECMMSGEYGERGELNSNYLEEVRNFITYSVSEAEKNGVVISAFEIGNEFWGSGQMTASEYGRLVSQLSPFIENVLSNLDRSETEIVMQTTSSASEVFSSNEDTIAFVDLNSGTVLSQREIDKYHDGVVPDAYSEISVPGQGPAYRQVAAIADPINNVPGAANSIDGIVDHYYVRNGLENVDNSFEFGFSQFGRLEALLDRSRNEESLEFHISEWNANATNAIDNRGMFHASMMIEMFYEQVTHGIDVAQIWPLTFDNSQSITLTNLDQNALSIAGEMFSLMSESLVGLVPICDWTVTNSVDIHGFADGVRSVFFISERSGEDKNSIQLDFGALLDAGRYTVSITEISDGDLGGEDHRAEPVIRHFDTVTVENLEIFLDLSSWSNTRLELIEVGERDDFLTGNFGNDELRGYGGNDTLSGGSGRDTIFGGDGADSLSGSSGWDRIHGGVGRDRISGGDEGDRLFGNRGDDTILSGRGADFTRGGIGNDRVKGNSGDDTIFGNSGNDVLFGNSGNDFIYGGDGNDRLVGGHGSDILVGGAGSDTFVFYRDGSNDTVMDFSETEDILNLSHWGAQSFESFSIIQIENNRGSVDSIIEFEAETLTLKNTSISNLENANDNDGFIF